MPFLPIKKEKKGSDPEHDSVRFYLDRKILFFSCVFCVKLLFF